MAHPDGEVDRRVAQVGVGNVKLASHRGGRRRHELREPHRARGGHDVRIEVALLPDHPIEDGAVDAAPI